MILLTPTIITDLCSQHHTTDDVNRLLTAFNACDNGTLDPYLATLSMNQARDLYNIASDLDVALNDNITAYDEDFISASNWITLSAKAAGQGHIH